MVAPRLRSCAIALGSALLLVGCELFVELDRSAADASDDAGCAICTDAFRDEDADAGPADTSPPDAGAPVDAHHEGAVADSGAKGGG